jgi:tRNA-dihydrouridine synthase A
MMDWTDRHCRAFHRIMTKKALLYTEMVTSAAITFGKPRELLAFSSCEQPVALQLGGCDRDELVLAARIGEDFGYSEINLNCGCPSDRVRKGSFGACLMADPERVADCVAAMGASVFVPVTVKCRIGIDDQSEEEPLDHFTVALSAAGCRTLIVHARKAWLNGLSPSENRSMPPLNHQRVYRLKRDHPHMEIIINGGISSLDEAEQHLGRVDGVMLGRAAYENPYLLNEIDRLFFDSKSPPPTRTQIIANYLPYVRSELASGTPLARITRHMLGLFHGHYGGRHFRRILAEESRKHDAGPGVFELALAATVRPHSQDLLISSRASPDLIRGSTRASASVAMREGRIEAQP